MESDVIPAARLYTDVFLVDEPTSRRHALDPARFFPYAQIYVRSLAGRDLSFLAREQRTGEPAGFIFSFDLTHDPASEGSEMAAFISHFREAVAMIDELEGRFLCPKETRPGVTLHIFQIGVDRKFRRNGIARDLICHLLANAKEHGFRQVIADCTNQASRQAFLHCGFSEQGFSSYETFSMDGRRFFAGLEGGISLMVRDI
ncbi:GNAT family N-acetyltransferase [uncultured Methanoregula sp.]|uniref:GNAT family N-acetyltransferase n=1 Tax=uncultured Methanoregula sp. TaxID=1005933 RepID=UPI00374901B5